MTAQAYPPMLVTAGLSDPRVTYWEPAKWVAKLRATKTDRDLLLLKTNMGAGHSGKSGRYVSLEEAAEEYAFLITQVLRHMNTGCVCPPADCGQEERAGQWIVLKHHLRDPAQIDVHEPQNPRRRAQLSQFTNSFSIVTSAKQSLAGR